MHEDPFILGPPDQEVAITKAYLLCPVPAGRRSKPNGGDSGQSYMDPRESLAILILLAEKMQVRNKR